MRVCEYARMRHLQKQLCHVLLRMCLCLVGVSQNTETSTLGTRLVRLSSNLTDDDFKVTNHLTDLRSLATLTEQTKHLQAAYRRSSSSLRPLLLPQALRQDQPGSQTQTSSQQGDCSAKCAGPSCTKGASESGPGGIPVCNDGSRCTELVYGCELCDAPIIEVQAHSKLQRDCELYYGLQNVTL
jgi:hypothetical protein